MSKETYAGFVIAALGTQLHSTEWEMLYNAGKENNLLDKLPDEWPEGLVAGTIGYDPFTTSPLAFKAELESGWCILVDFYEENRINPIHRAGTVSMSVDKEGRELQLPVMRWAGASYNVQRARMELKARVFEVMRKLYIKLLEIRAAGNRLNEEHLEAVKALLIEEALEEYVLPEPVGN